MIPQGSTSRPCDPSRRRLLLGGAGLSVASTLTGSTQLAAQSNTPPLASSIPLVPPRTEFAYEVIVDLEPTLSLGQSPIGERRMVPIVGGTFEGPNIRGKVLPGGADRQLVRRDGVRQLNALYELQTDDGAINLPSTTRF